MLAQGKGRWAVSQKRIIHPFHIPRNAPYFICHPKFCISIVFEFTQNFGGQIRCIVTGSLYLFKKLPILPSPFWLVFVLWCGFVGILQYLLRHLVIAPVRNTQKPFRGCSTSLQYLGIRMKLYTCKRMQKLSTLLGQQCQELLRPFPTTRCRNNIQPTGFANGRNM